MEKKILDLLEKKIIDILQNEVKSILDETRKNMVVVEEKKDGDSATIADIKIGEIFDTVLPQILPDSVVIQEESFDEEIYKKALNTKYVWVVDPIDGTKAFRDVTNNEWCVGVCLLEDLNPILSLVYIPEKWLDKPYLLSANKFRDELFDFGKRVEKEERQTDSKYVSHIHRDTKRNQIENKIADIYPCGETIRAYAGHSTLAQFSEVAINKNKIFTRREANVWDIIQGAYLIKKSGGEVFYESGENVFPLNPNVLQYKDCHLIMPFTIACSLENKEKIINKVNSR
jgi:3'-phosphoadenosine 5'-phosphosulfate (PAPS) 3'-phosphatase